MRARRTNRHSLASGASVLALVAFVGLRPCPVSAQAAQTLKSFAQKLVDAAHAQHPEVDEIGIMTTTRRGCIGIASTDTSDIGEKCEADDVQPMKTGKPSVGKEEGGFDVSVPLHDAKGRTIGVLGVGFKPTPGQTEASAIAEAGKIEAQMAARISSKARLFTRTK